MTLNEMIAKLTKEAAHEQIDPLQKAWASRLAVALTEIDRRLTALERTAGIGPEIDKDAADIRAFLDKCATFVDLDWLAEGVGLSSARVLHVVRAAGITHRWLRR